MTMKKLSSTDLTRKKIPIPSEIAYLLAIVVLSFAVSILTVANLGISMIVAPAYLISIKFDFITFGQAEYIIQAIVLILMCIIVRKFKLLYLVSFLTCLLYGFVLDLWNLLPVFNPSAPISLEIRILMFVAGIVLTAFSVALFFKTYIYPQVYDLFVKVVSQRFSIKLSLFKTLFDLFMLITSILMTVIFFGTFVGLSWGTAVMAILNGSLIGFFSSLLDRFFRFYPIFPKFASYFKTE